MIIALIIIGYVLFVAGLIRFFQCVHGWYEQIREMPGRPR